MYWEDHTPAHFYAQYGKHQVMISIRDGVVLKGLFPAKQLKLVLAWCEIHKPELLNNWQAAKKHGALSKIEPLH